MALKKSEQIQNALTEKRQEIGQRIADLPSTEANVRENLVGSDPALSTLRSQETDKVKELFEHDKAVAAQYTTPPEPGMVLDPYIRELQLTNRYRGTMEDLAGIRQNISTRQDILGSMVEKAMKVFEKAIDAMKFEYTGLEGDLGRALDAEKPKGGGTSGERAKAAAMAALERDVQRGVPFYELYPRYGDILEEYEIREVYNAGPLAGKYGPAKETSGQLRTETEEPDVFSVTQSTVQAGVAGLPVTPENLAKYQAWLNSQDTKSGSTLDFLNTVSGGSATLDNDPLGIRG